MGICKFDLTEKQKKAADNLLDGINPVEACERAGYSEKTSGSPTQNVFGRESVRSYINDKLADQLAVNSQRLSQMTEDAIEGIYELAISSNTKENVKLKALKTILDRNEELKEQLGIDVSNETSDDSDESLGLDLSRLDESEREKTIELLSKAKAEE